MVLGSFTGIRIGLSTIKAFCDVKEKPCVSVSSLEALAYTLLENSAYTSTKETVGISSENTLICDNSYICSLIDAKHSNVYAGIFEKTDGKIVKINDFMFDNIDNILSVLNSLKKKIFFVGNCGILYKDVIESYLKNEVYFSEDTLVSSKYIGLSAFDKFNKGEISSSKTLTALYLKKSSAEETLEGKV